MHRYALFVFSATLSACGNGGLFFVESRDAAVDACADVTDCPDVPVCHAATCATGACFYSGLRTGDPCDGGGTCDMGVCK